jgi:hypothetical protein
MYDGYLTYAGMELVNAERTVAYGRALLPTLGLSGYECMSLQQAVSDAPYDTPAADGAEWYDPDHPASGGFIGFYPSGLQGIRDSTRTGETSEAIGSGGFNYATRDGTREIRVKGVCIGTTPESAEYGMAWVKGVLEGPACGGACFGSDICFFLDCPTILTWERLIRTVRGVECTSGPSVISERALSCGGYMIEIEFILTASVPYLYGWEQPVASAQGAALQVLDPSADIFLSATVPACVQKAPPAPLIDPDCEPVPTPPTVPAIGGACAPEPSSYTSYAIHIPKEMLLSWQDVVPRLVIRTGAGAVRHLRVRFLARVPSTLPLAQLDPCGACAEFTVNYIPPSTMTTIDGSIERVTMAVSNSDEQSAEHLVSGPAGDVFNWPVLSCGIGYYALIDVDSTSVIGLELSIRSRE